MRRRALVRALGLATDVLGLAAAWVGLWHAVLLRVRYLWLFAVVVVGVLCLVVGVEGLVVVGEPWLN